MVGRFLAFAIFQEQYLPLSLSQVTCKLLLHAPIKLQDVRRVDPEFYKNRVALVDKEGGLEEMAAILMEPLTFISAPTELMREPTELIPGGASIEVTEERKQEYLLKLCEAYLCNGIRKELTCLLQGFWELLPPQLLKENDISPQDIALLICGFKEIDLEDWKSSATCSGSPELQNWFWDIVNEMTQEDRCRLLQFSTGSSRLPPGGFANLDPNFKIEIGSGEASHLPSAHTCFNQLCIPPYTSKEQMQEALKTALKYGEEGFGVV